MADSWREAAGRTSGDDGYRFGDLSRSLVRRGSLKLQQWAEKPKQRDGYEFGDLTAAAVRWLAQGEDAPEGTAPAAGAAGSPATTEHEEIAERLTRTRREALELLEANLPLLKARLSDLEGRAGMLGAWELSAMLRLKGRGDGSPSALSNYEKILEDVKQSMAVWPAITADLVRSSGSVAILEPPLLHVLGVARECAACARDVGAAAATSE